MLLSLLLLLLASSPAVAQLWSGVVDPTRATDWSQAGVVGGVPDTSGWTVCTTANCNTLFAGTVTATSIQNALAGCPTNGIVRVPSGTYSVAAFTFNRNNCVLRGAGGTATRLNMTSTASGGGLGGDLGAAVTMNNGATATAQFGGANTATWTAATYNQGQTTLTLSSTTGIVAGAVGSGTLLLLDQCNDGLTGASCTGTETDGYPATGDLFVCDGTAAGCSNQGSNAAGRSNRSQVEVVTVIGLAGSVATISPGLRAPNWRSGQAPGAHWVPTTLPLTNSGLENLTIDHTATANIALKIMNSANVWVKGVRIVNTSTGDTSMKHIFVQQSAHVTIKDNYFWGRAGATSPIDNYTYTHRLVSDVLVENNIWHRNVIPIVPNDPSTGNVYSYNYVDDAHTFGSSIQWHSGTVFYDLAEGNNLKVLLGDVIHGVHYMVTAFRNHFDRTAHNPTGTTPQAIALNSNNRFFNIIGNVAGHSGYTRYKQSCPGDSGCAAWTYGGDSAAAFVLGVPGTGSGTATLQDTHVGRTAMLWGNWDNVTSTNDTATNDSTGTRFVSAEVPSGIPNYANPVPASQVLPPSFYLSARPDSWWGTPWGTPAWPAIGPDVSSGTAPNTSTTPTGGHANKIPARLCFENTAVDSGYAGTSPQVRAFDAATCYIGSALSDPPTLTITTNGGNGAGVDFTTGTTPLTTLAGTASDDVAVSSVTWSCPTCTPTSGTATGTTSWSVASVGLASGANVFAVTATDADTQTAQDTLTVTYTALVEVPTVLRLLR